MGRATLVIGLDLAWSPRHGSGAVVLAPADGGVLRADASRILGGDDEIVAYLRQHGAAAGRLLVGIDAPLLAPNPPGTAREADRQVTRLYGRHHAGAYPANRERCPRPLALAERLRREGFSLDPAAVAGGAPRVALEVHPHAASVGLFGLARIPKYKKGPVAQRRAGLAAFQQLLQERLPRLDPPLRPFAAEDTAPLRGRALKALEDRLDALLCAAMVAVYARHPRRCVIACGADQRPERDGYILVPSPPARTTPRVGPAGRWPARRPAG